MKLPHILMLIFGMGIMWYFGFLTGVRFAMDHYTLVNETQPRVITHTNK